ncbi:MAG: NfeD family protein [Dysgonamonadaceae bacterium]|jgi:membrane-bound serine protease (ClpP class)|nr:NfeD family protein [Dysgonamonadaceae bacterium]
MKKTRTFIFLLLFLSALEIFAQESKQLIYRINIKENIGSNTMIYLQNGLRKAQSEKATCVLLHMNTYGGGVMEADSMRTAILNSELPVYVFIDNNAASAGALISIACDSIYMRKGATIGAATVVSATDGMAAPDKYQSYMRGMMRATAESHGKDTVIVNGKPVEQWRRDPKIAEAMVDEKVVVPQLDDDSTRVLTLTAEEAVKLGYCEGIAESIHEVATSYLGYKDYEIKTYNPTIYDHIRGFLMNGIVQALLIMIIIGAVYFEIQAPGIGAGAAIAIIAAILYFTPLFLSGYAQSWEIIIFVIGLILIVLELFVIPGFGIAGALGIIFMITGLLLAMIGNINFNFEGVSLNAFFKSLMTLLAGLGLGFALIIYASSRIGKKGFLKNVALNADQEGYMSVSMEPASIVGKSGIAATVLRPSGRVEVDGELYDAASIFGFIDKGESIIVRRYENSQVYVVRKPNSSK